MVIRKIIAGVYILIALVASFLLFDYVIYYNIGNGHYEKMDYEEATKAYEKALDANPPEGKECAIRINLALSMVYGLGDDYDENSIDVVKEARNVLLEEDCATSSGDGHSETAQKLKEELDDLIEELEKKQEQGDSGASKKEQEDKEESDAKEQNLKEQLQQNQADAYKERQSELEFSAEFDKDFNFDLDTPIW